MTDGFWKNLKINQFFVPHIHKERREKRRDEYLYLSALL